MSTDQQQGGLASQAMALDTYFKREGITNFQVFQDEGVSGSKTSRPALDEMMKLIGENQCKMLVVFSFSRFSRSCSHLLQMVEYLKKQGTQLVSISEQVDTQSSVGQALIAVLGALAQLERDLIRERVTAGLIRARSLGKHIGRKKTRNSELIRALLKSGMTLRGAAKVANCSHGSISLERSLMRQEEAAQKQAERERAEKLASGEALVVDGSSPW